MKKWLIVGLGCWWFAATAGAQENAFRAFTSVDGRSLEARIVGNDTATGKVQIERRNGKKVWVTPDLFSEADQGYIKEWIAVDTFLSPRTLGISLQLKEKKSFNQYTKVEYELKFYNKSGAPIQINGIDHLCLVQRNVHRINGEDTDYLQNYSGRVEISEETSWGIWEYRYPLQLKSGRHSEIVPGFHVLDEDRRDEQIKGVWVRIKGPSLNGKAFYREVRLPEELRVEESWDETRKTARNDLLNPYREKKKKATRTAGAKPKDELEYFRWFNEIRNEGDFYMSSRPVKLAEAKKCYEELKALYDPQYESPSEGGRACFVAWLAYKVHDYQGCAEWYEISLEVVENVGNRRELCALYSSGIKGVTDGQKAIEHGKRLVAENPEDAMDQELLARAYARAGQFDLAIETQEIMIELVKKNTKKKSLESNLKGPLERLEQYKQGKPYYDRPPDGFS